MLLLTKTIFAAIGAWFLSLLILFVFPHVLPILSGFAILLSLPIAVILFVLTLIAFTKERDSIPISSVQNILLVIGI